MSYPPAERNTAASPPKERPAETARRANPDTPTERQANTMMQLTYQPSDHPHYEVVEVTPALAEKWLAESNTHNRKTRPRTVDSYATDMVNGDWCDDGTPIQFSRNGTVLNGQHRLRAVVKSGVTLRVLVVSNLPEEVQESMDTGIPRSFADVLTLRGEKDAHNLATAVRRVHLWEAGVRTDNRMPVSTRQLLKTLDRYPDLRESMLIARRGNAKTGIPAAWLALAHWMFRRIDEEDAEFFFARLADGLYLGPNDSIYALRQTAERARKDYRRTPPHVLLAYVIKAWNAYRDGRPVSQLKYRPGGSKPELFPEPR